MEGAYRWSFESLYRPDMQSQDCRHTCSHMEQKSQSHCRLYTLSPLRPGFESEEEFVEHMLARQQEIHELVCRNTHQAQLRQKQSLTDILKQKHTFCHIILKGHTRKLLRTWRGPFKVTDVLPDGRLFVLDTGQKVHFERLKKHVPAPWKTAMAKKYPTYRVTHSFQSNRQRHHLRLNQPRMPRTIQTRTQSALEQGIPRGQFSLITSAIRLNLSPIMGRSNDLWWTLNNHWFFLDLMIWNHCSQTVKKSCRSLCTVFCPH